MIFFIELEKNSQIYMELRKLQIGKTVLSKKKKNTGGNAIPVFKLYNRAKVIKKKHDLGLK
jgi:hypothetical protein